MEIKLHLLLPIRICIFFVMLLDPTIVLSSIHQDGGLNRQPPSLVLLLSSYHANYHHSSSEQNRTIVYMPMENGTSVYSYFSSLLLLVK